MCGQCERLLQEVRSLRDELDLAQETVRQLNETLAPPSQFPVAWRLRPSEKKLLAALVSAPGEYVTRQRLRVAVGGLDCMADENLISVYVSRLRPILREHGIEIVNVWGEGYQLSPDSKTILAPYVATPQQVAA